MDSLGPSELERVFACSETPSRGGREIEAVQSLGVLDLESQSSSLAMAAVKEITKSINEVCRSQGGHYAGYSCQV